MAKKVIVKQIKSQIGRDVDVRNALSTLGLGKVGKVREFQDSPSLQGTLRKLSALVSVTEA